MKKRRHYQIVCHNPPSKIDSIQESEFLGHIQAVKGDEKSWNITHQLIGQPCQFMLDTEADVTEIPEDNYRSLDRIKLQPSDQVLRGASLYQLKIKGTFTDTLCYNVRESK